MADFFNNNYGDSFDKDYVSHDYQLQYSGDVINKNYNELIDAEDFYFIVVGTDYGFLYKYFLENKSKTTVKIVFFESSEVIEKLGLNDRLGWVDDSLGLFSFDSEFSFSKNIQQRFLVLKNIKVINSLKKSSQEVQKKYDEFYNSINSRIISHLSSFHIYNTKKNFEHPAILNLSNNLTPAIKLKNNFKGKSAVILGGGPSLDDSIEWVKENRDNLYIFAVGRIAKRLMHENIIPDFLGYVDPQSHAYEHAKAFLGFADQNRFKKQPLLINAFHINNDLLTQWGGKAVFLGARSNLFNDNNIPAYGPTVSHALVGAAAEFGFSRIFFSGIDLCFFDGKTHEGMSEEAESQKLVVANKEGFWLINNSGISCPTNRALFQGHKSLEDIVSIYKKASPDLKFYSLSEKSALISGVEFIKPNRVIFDERSCVLGTDLVFLEIDFNAKLIALDLLKREVDSTLDKFSSYSAQAKKILKKYDVKSNLKNYFFTANDLNELSHLQASVKLSMGKDFHYLLSLDIEQFKDSYLLTSEVKSTQRNMRAYQAWFKAVYRLSNYVCDLLNKSLQRIELRKKELQLMVGASVDFEVIYQAWREANQLGRVMFVNNFKAVELNPDLQQKLDAISNDFLQSLGVNNRIEKLKKLNTDPDSLWKNLVTAYNSQDLLALKRIADVLVNQPDLSNLLLIAQGAVAFVDGDQIRAMRCYESALNNATDIHKRFCLDELLKLSLNTQDFNKALGYAEQLCQYSLEYMKTFAKLLKILGNFVASTEVLSMYVRVYKDDLGAHILLAEQYHEQGRLLEAKAHLDQVLAVEPNHKAALHYKKVWISD